MADLTYAQLESLWEQAGGSSATAPVAAAIALAESSGNATVTSSNPDGGTNVGLWQLDTPGGVGSGYSVSQLQNPLTNAQVAVRGSGNGSNWSDWATYASGAYKKFLQGGAVPGPSTVPGPVTSSGGGGTGGTDLLTGYMSQASGLLHAVAVLVDRAFALFAPGQGWRIVFAVSAVVLALLAYHSFGGSVSIGGA